MPSSNHSPRSTLRDDDLQEMLGHAPGWILHSGITLLFLIITVALLLSWLIRYPDELPAQMTIVQSVPPHEIRPLITAKVDTIFKRDGEVVKAGDRIVLLESAANWQHVDSLWALLQLKHATDWPERLQLGSMQGRYAIFMETNNNLQFFNKRTIFQQRQDAINAEIVMLQKLEEAQIGRQHFFLKEKVFMQKQLERTQALFEEGVCTAVELEEQQKQLLKYEQQLKDMEVTLLQNAIRMQQLRARLAESQDEFLKNRNELELQKEQARRQLKGAIEEWYAQYMLSSPIEGQLEWPVQFGMRHTIQSGNILGVIVPKNSKGKAIASLRLPAAGVGKIAVGAPVKISLAAYPEQEFGQVAAEVDEISLVPTSNGESSPTYTLKVYLSDTLKTSYGKHIPITPNMPGSATVITKDLRILERIMQQLTDVIRNN